MPKLFHLRGTLSVTANDRAELGAFPLRGRMPLIRQVQQQQHLVASGLVAAAEQKPPPS